MGVRGLFHCVCALISLVFSLPLLLSPLTIPTQMFTGGRGSGSTAWWAVGAAGDKGAALWGGVQGVCPWSCCAQGPCCLRCATGLQRGAQFAFGLARQSFVVACCLRL
jgi:hypothetical protein